MNKLIERGRMLLTYQGNGTPMLSQKIGRNDKCACGSGKKAKRCCGVETKYFHSNKQSNELPHN